MLDGLALRIEDRLLKLNDYSCFHVLQAEGRRQKAEGRRQKAEGRRQKAEVRTP